MKSVVESTRKRPYRMICEKMTSGKLRIIKSGLSTQMAALEVNRKRMNVFLFSYRRECASSDGEIRLSDSNFVFQRYES